MDNTNETVETPAAQTVVKRVVRRVVRKVVSNDENNNHNSVVDIGNNNNNNLVDSNKDKIEQQVVDDKKTLQHSTQHDNQIISENTNKLNNPINNTIQPVTVQTNGEVLQENAIQPTKKIVRKVVRKVAKVEPTDHQTGIQQSNINPLNQHDISNHKSQSNVMLNDNQNQVQEISQSHNQQQHIAPNNIASKQPNESTECDGISNNINTTSQPAGDGQKVIKTVKRVVKRQVVKENPNTKSTLTSNDQQYVQLPHNTIQNANIASQKIINPSGLQPAHGNTIINNIGKPQKNNNNNNNALNLQVKTFYQPDMVKQTIQLCNLLNKYGPIFSYYNIPQQYHQSLHFALDMMKKNCKFVDLRTKQEQKNSSSSHIQKYLQQQNTQWVTKHLQVVLNQQMGISHIPLYSNNITNHPNNINSKEEENLNPTKPLEDIEKNNNDNNNSWLITAHQRWVDKVNNAKQVLINQQQQQEKESHEIDNPVYTPLLDSLLLPNQVLNNLTSTTTTTTTTTDQSNTETNSTVPIFYLVHHPPIIPIQHYTYHWYFRLSTLITFYTKIVNPTLQEQNIEPNDDINNQITSMSLTTDYSNYSLISHHNQDITTSKQQQQGNEKDLLNLYNPQQFLKQPLEIQHFLLQIQRNIYPSCETRALYTAILNETQILLQYGLGTDQKVAQTILTNLRTLPIAEMLLPTTCGYCVDATRFIILPTITSCRCTPNMKQLFKVQIFAIVSCIKRGIYDTYMQELHHYNEIKESCSLMMAKIANHQNDTIAAVYNRFIDEDLKVRERQERGN